MKRLTRFGLKIFLALPDKWQNYIFEAILRLAPLPLIRRLPFSYGIYLRCCDQAGGGTIIDCGAHIGNCAILFSRLAGPEGCVICLEPFEGSYRRLMKTKNRLGLDNVIALNKGVWNESGRFPLEIFQDTVACRLHSGNATAGKASDAVTIECTTIDELVEELNLRRVDLIKMDIEGAEIEALQGARNTLAEFRPQVAIASYHHREGRPTAPTVEKILNGSRYDCKTFFPPHLTTCGKPR